MEDKLIYIADDEVKIQEIMKLFLEKEGFKVKTFSDGAALLDVFLVEPADMLVIDIMMPNLDGLSLCSEIRKVSNVPIIIVSAKDSESDKIAGFVIGSDDYLTKPFSPVELVLRVKSIFKRITFEKTQKTNANIDLLYVCDVVINPNGRYAQCNGEDLKLTPMEFNLLLYLAKHQNKGVSRDELLNKVWGFNAKVDTRATDDMIKRIRKKLISVNSKVNIETLWGFGFMISTDK